MARIEALITVLDRKKGRLLIAFGVAALLHFPLTPALPILRLANRWAKNKPEAPPPPAVELVDVGLAQALKSEERRSQAKARAPEKPATMQMQPPPSVKFAAGAPKPEDSGSDTPKEPKREKLKAVGLEGDLSKKLLGKPAVTLGLWLSSLREHPLGARLGEILACDREWKRFLDQGVDVMRDFDGMLVVGPTLFDSSQLTAVVRHELPPERVHEIMQTLVESSGERGRWLAPDIASARLGRSQRVLLPQARDIFFVTPSKGWEALSRTKEPLRVPRAEGRTASLTLVNPNRSLGRIGLTLPKPIQELRVEVFANTDESVDLKVELEASSESAARDEQSRVSAQMRDFFADVWTAATALGALTGTGSSAHLELPPRLELERDEATFSGMAHLSPNQARATLNLLASFSCSKKGTKRRALK